MQWFDYCLLYCHCNIYATLGFFFLVTTSDRSVSIITLLSILTFWRSLLVVSNTFRSIDS